MDIIEKIAEEIYTIYIKRGPKKHEEIILKIRGKIYDIDNKLDQIKFLTFILNKTKGDFEKHLPLCTAPKTCSKNFQYESIIYYIQQELQRLGIVFNEDTFTVAERLTADEKIDEILEKIKKLEFGQAIYYEDVTKDIQEMKSLHFLGKRKWSQLIIGKLTEMSLSGIVSETISKGFITLIKTGLKLIAN